MAGSEGAELILRVATLPVMRSRVILGSWGMLMPNSSAVCKTCWSTSSSDSSIRKTIMRYVSSSFWFREARSMSCMSDSDRFFEAAIARGQGCSGCCKLNGELHVDCPEIDDLEGVA